MKKTYSLKFEIVMLSDEDVIRTSSVMQLNGTFSGFDIDIGDDSWDLG